MLKCRVFLLVRWGEGWFVSSTSSPPLLFPSKGQSGTPHAQIQGKEEGNIKGLPLMADGFEFVFVLRVGLDPEAGGEDELADCGAEAGEESIEGLETG